MIGYNIDQINALITKINKSYEKIGEAMTGGWSEVSTTLETEWVGPDEISFETELAKRLCELYASCREGITGLMKDIASIGESWIAFQKSNLLSGATAGTMGGVSEKINIIELADSSSVSSVIKCGEPTFNDSTKFGVVNGISSADTINSKIGSYVTNVYDTINNMCAEFSSAEAFLGSGQSEKIDEYIQTVTRQVAKVTTCVQDLRVQLTKLVEAYNAQADQFKSDVKAASEAANIQVENSVLDASSYR